ncbi:unnamed protein product, partial [Iphiclides podalirius]
MRISLEAAAKRRAQLRLGAAPGRSRRPLPPLSPPPHPAPLPPARAPPRGAPPAGARARPAAPRHLLMRRAAGGDPPRTSRPRPRHDRGTTTTRPRRLPASARAASGGRAHPDAALARPTERLTRGRSTAPRLGWRDRSLMERKLF